MNTVAFAFGMVGGILGVISLTFLVLYFMGYFDAPVEDPVVDDSGGHKDIPEKVDPKTGLVDPVDPAATDGSTDPTELPLEVALALESVPSQFSLTAIDWAKGSVTMDDTYMGVYTRVDLAVTPSTNKWGTRTAAWKNPNERYILVVRAVSSAGGYEYKFYAARSEDSEVYGLRLVQLVGSPKYVATPNILDLPADMVWQSTGSGTHRTKLVVAATGPVA